MYKKYFLSFFIIFSASVTHARSPITTEKNEETTPDNEEVPYLLRQFAEKGDADSYYQIAWMYDKGVGVLQDSTQAAEWYVKSAQKGNNEAQNRVAVMYERGEGVPQDFEQAIYWYRESVKQGNAWAKHRLDLLYETPAGQKIVKREKEKSDLLNNQASSQQNRESQFQLALIGLQKLGTPQSYDQNIEWCGLSEEQEDVLAKNYLATVNNTNDSTAQDQKIVFD